MAGAYYKEIDRGYPGTLSRTSLGGDRVETRVAGENPLYFGMAVSLDAAGNVVPFDLDNKIHGFLVRPFPKQGNATLFAQVEGSYEGELVSVMLRGYMSVNMEAGTVVPGDPVFATDYVEGTPPTATVSGTGTDAVPGAVFMSPATGGMTEISLGIVSPAIPAGD